MASERSLAAFFSYVHKDDEHDRGVITRLRNELQGEVGIQLGESFSIFLDRDDIAWGESWRRRIEESLDAVTLLIPIITPAYFNSKACRGELERFLERERELGRDDLILPIYYVSAPTMDDPARRDADEVARVLASRQYADWRELRFEPFTSPVFRQRLAQLATRMRDSFWRTSPPAPSERPASQNVARSDATKQQGPAPQGGRSVPTDVAAERKEPPTRTVDPWGRADHTSIGEAIAAAQPGDRIIVGPGLYEEGLTIDKPLEILGQGPVEM